MRQVIRSISNSVVALAAVLAVLPFPGCGSSSSDRPGPGSTPGPTPGPIAQGSAVVPAHGFLPVTLTTTGSGTLNVQLGLTPNIVVSGIVTSGCTAASTRASCRTLSYTEGESTDSSKTLIVAGVTAGSYALILGNVGAGNQAVAYTVTLTAS